MTTCASCVVPVQLRFGVCKCGECCPRLTVNVSVVPRLHVCMCKCGVKIMRIHAVNMVPGLHGCEYPCAANMCMVPSFGTNVAVSLLLSESVLKCTNPLLHEQVTISKFLFKQPTSKRSV